MVNHVLLLVDCAQDGLVVESDLDRWCLHLCWEEKDKCNFVDSALLDLDSSTVIIER